MLFKALSKLRPSLPVLLSIAVCALIVSADVYADTANRFTGCITEQNIEN
jgi:hypothetical protein